jgi:hypothetical protein
MAVERLEVPATGDLAGLGELKAALLARLAAGQPAYLDARHVDEPSAALIQLIEAAAAAFGEKSLGFGLVEPSDALCAGYETIGLFAQLMSRIAMDA